MGKAIGELLANRLKDSLPKNAAVPVPAPPARSVTVGTTIACSLHEDKSVHCWGWQVDPLVGPVPSKTPLSDVVEIAAGSRVVCARLASGGIECLGKDRQEASTKPYVVGSVCGIAKASKLAMNSETGCALVEGGKVRCWSVEQRNPQDQPCAYPSSEIGGVHHASALSLGSTALCALVGGKVLCWGDNTASQLGQPPIAGDNRSRTPLEVPAIGDAVEVSAGDDFTCVLRRAGVSCWGRNDSAQLGTASVAESAIPIPVQLSCP